MTVVEGNSGTKRHFDVRELATLMSTAVASRFRLESKGTIGVGKDADISWGVMQPDREIAAHDVAYRHPDSPWNGVASDQRAHMTVVEGNSVPRRIWMSIGNIMRSDNAFEVWGGISGCQHLRAAMLTYGTRSRDIADVIEELGYLGTTLGTRIDLNQTETGYSLLLGQSLSSTFMPSKGAPSDENTDVEETA